MNGKRTIKKVAVAGAVVAGVAGASLALPAGSASAYAGTPGCVTLTEYRAVTKGMTQLQVARRFGTYAHPYWGGATYSYTGDFGNEVDREYRVCTSAGRPMASWRGYVDVDFESAYTDYGTSYGPVRLTTKSRVVF